ncbi:hypothetical protein CC78DRAFT_611205 [Lojkania enalia]|uniref:Elongator complex protein 6 n=1 Tax=Lojkania enalia TaxID=147567 RepID=A0A9P4NDB9_9PLEO|nr:hypothetical protein CC78DRAFT_611205 [Didymosphaeria enalia]
MPPESRIPPLLQPYTRLPKHPSLFLLTGTLGATANWLIIRFLCDVLATKNGSRAAENDKAGDEVGEGGTAVVLVSWIREYEFWRNEARKGAGLDLQRLGNEKRVAFVDGLSRMYMPEVGKQSITQNTVLTTPQTQNMVTARTPARMTPWTPPAPLMSTSEAKSDNKGYFFLHTPDLKAFEETVMSATAYLESSSRPPKSILLILDAPDTLLATEPGITPSALASTILQLHAKMLHAIVHVSADDALLSLSMPPQPLEISGHNFLVGMAHGSKRVISCRVLDTGVAKDVSGVLRITGGAGGGFSELFGEDEERVEARELLYLVKGDGSVKVFERGAGEG